MGNKIENGIKMIYRNWMNPLLLGIVAERLLISSKIDSLLFVFVYIYSISIQDKDRDGELGYFVVYLRG